MSRAEPQKESRMTSVPLAPRTGGAAFLALLALALWPGRVAATPTTNGGQQYADECKAAGVPAPPEWNLEDTKWVFKGNQDPTKLILPGEETVVNIYLYKSYAPQGICVAITRKTPSAIGIKKMEIICQGHTGKVCFWDNVNGPLPPTGPATIVGGTLFAGGKDLELGPLGACTRCHGGDNPFIVFPDTALDLKDSKGVPILNSGTWPDPLVAASWPQNPPPVTGLSENGCVNCHIRPTVAEPKKAGRIPGVSSSGMGDWCFIVMNNVISMGLMPNHEADVAFLTSKCRAPLETPTPLNEIQVAFKGRFVFGDQDSNIYAVAKNGELLYFKHSGDTNGTNHWNISAKVVGSGWDTFRKVFTAGQGVIYAITGDNKLLWYQHIGQVEGTPDWAPASGSQVGSGWAFKQVFATTAGDRAIYGLADNGDLLWYKHTGFSTGAPTWAAGSGNVVRTGLNDLSRLMAGANGSIYGVNSDNDLVWYGHTGQASGTNSWAPNSGAVVGWGWSATTLFTGSQGRIYTIDSDAGLNWYRHLGWQDGAATWVDVNPRLVGSVWDFMVQPYFD
jgi:hypothetical protein